MSKIPSKLEYEWSMGNGQCPVCYGKDQSFARQSPQGILNCGHLEGCWLAADLPDPLMRQVDDNDPKLFGKRETWTDEYRERMDHPKCPFTDRIVEEKTDG